MDLLQTEAETDELTGLPNRRTFTDTAEKLFRSSENISLFMLDIDHFKGIAIEQQDYIHTRRTGRAIPFTVSIGVATRAPGEAEVGAVLKRADQALYKAKEGGRNRVERA